MNELESDVKDLSLYISILTDTLTKTMKAMEIVIHRVEAIEKKLEDIE